MAKLLLWLAALSLVALSIIAVATSLKRHRMLIITNLLPHDITAVKVKTPLGTCANLDIQKGHSVTTSPIPTCNNQIITMITWTGGSCKLQPHLVATITATEIITVRITPAGCIVD